jgi:hypothetical protein
MNNQQKAEKLVRNMAYYLIFTIQTLMMGFSIFLIVFGALLIVMAGRWDGIIAMLAGIACGNMYRSLVEDCGLTTSHNFFVYDLQNPPPHNDSENKVI